MFSTLDKIDFAYTGRDGRTHWMQTDHRPPDEIEAEPEISLIFALIRLIGPQQAKPVEGSEPVIEYMCTLQPPEFLRAAIAATGASLLVEELVPLPYAGELEDPETIADRAFGSLAARLSGQLGLNATLAALPELESRLPALSPEADEYAYWRTVVQFGALVAEGIRAEVGGRWRVRHDLGTLPFVFVVGSDSETPLTLNPLGKAIKLLQNGPEQDSLAQFLEVFVGLGRKLRERTRNPSGIGADGEDM